MRKLLGLALPLLMGTGIVVGAAAHAGPSETYSGPYFGDGNLPPGCIRSMSPDNPENVCHHMRVGLNALDSPKIDVVVAAPVSPTVERDLRVMTQSVEMWAGGIDYLADEMDMPWLRDVEFRISSQVLEGEIEDVNLVDPEIVVLATNPVGGIGIGIDPVSFVGELGILDGEGAPCTGIPEPLDFGSWLELEGFDQHHDRSGTYVEDCGGAGGNVCFAVNGAIDPVPGTTDVFGLFDLVSHEVGHCLTVGHVGDGAEGSWGVVPTNDIMSYSEDPPGMSKCVSTLDVEGFALRMSRYLDRDRDGEVTRRDRLQANDAVGDGRNAFQVQSPSDHLYASETGSPLDCPQPDVGLLPTEKVDWSPTPVTANRPVLRLRKAARDGATLRLGGTVSFAPEGPQPRKARASAEDASGDSLSPFNDLQKLTVDVTDTTLEATLRLSQLWPTTQLTSVAGYSLVVDGHRYDSFVAPGESVVSTRDNGFETYLPDASEWDTAAGTVTFRLSRAYLASRGITAPYQVRSQSNISNGTRTVAVDDHLPEGFDTIGVTGRAVRTQPERSLAFTPPTDSRPYRVRFGSKAENTFSVTSSNLGETLVADNHVYAMQVRSPSRVEVTLDWDDPSSDLDLTVAQQGGDTVSGPGGKPETVVLDRVQGLLDLTVAPFLVGPQGTGYTLTATVAPLGKDSDGDGLTDPGDACPAVRGPAPSGCPDGDRDGVPDKSDRCPELRGGTTTGCPPPATEWIRVYVDGQQVRSTRVDRELGVGRFRLGAPLPPGRHAVRVVWAGEDGVLAQVRRTVG